MALSALKWHLHQANLLVAPSPTDYKELQVDFSALGKPLRTLSPLFVLTQPNDKDPPRESFQFFIFSWGGSRLKNAQPIPSKIHLCAINRLPSELVFFFLPKSVATESKSSATLSAAAIYLVDGLH